jgi:hypothetical protein
MKIETKSNYRIVVEPKTIIYGFKLSKETVESDLKEMKEQIKRHVDNVGRVIIDYDVDETCSHCGLGWELSEDDNDPNFPKGCPVCCQDAIDEWKTDLPQQKK